MSNEKEIKSIDYSRLWLVIGTSCGFLSVLVGAFGAHVLRTSLTSEFFEIYQTANHYLFVHSLALFILGAWGQNATFHNSLLYKLAGFAFTLGIVLFSGSLYALVLTNVRSFGAITPLGGLSFLLGWIFCIRLAIR